MAHAATVSTFSGPTDLDLSGDFTYAVNILGPSYVVSGQTFTEDNAPGISVTPGIQDATWVNKPEYGADTDSNNLEQIMWSIRYSNTQFDVDLDVSPGQLYKLQLLLTENFHSSTGFTRIADIEIEGATEVSGLDVLAVQGPRTPDIQGSGISFQGVVVTHPFVASDATLNISIIKNAASDDPNMLLNGLTLERIPEPSALIVLSLGVAFTLAARVTSVRSG